MMDAQSLRPDLRLDWTRFSKDCGGHARKMAVALSNLIISSDQIFEASNKTAN